MPGGCPPATPATWWLAITAVLLVIAGGGLLMWSGLVRPRLAAHADGWATHPDTMTFEILVQIENRGQRTLDVHRIGSADGTGLELISVTGLPATVRGSASSQVNLTYRVTDCAAVPVGSWPLQVHVQRAWGEQTVDVVPSVDTWDSTREWQRELAQEVCHPDETPPGAG